MRRLQRQKPKRWILGLAAAAVISAAAVFYKQAPLNQSEGDQMSERQVQQITEQFRNAVADFPRVDLKDPQQRAQAEAALNLPKAEAQNVIKDAEAGKFELAWVTVWDNYAEDADVVKVDSQGFSTTVNLLNRPVTVVVPVSSGKGIQITGIRDGGGGITAGFRTATGEVVVPPLVPGQVITLPVR